MHSTMLTEQSTGRLVFIDGLRGLAALGVAAHHFFQHRLFEPTTNVAKTVGEVANQGHLGVPVFFVISGYVISLSVGDRCVTPEYAARFALRRALRLSPAYWFTIAFVAATTVLAGKLFPDYSAPLPSRDALLSQLFFTFEFFGHEPILPVFWTLAHEVQFYLLLLAAWFVVDHSALARRPTAAALLFLSVPGVASAFSPGVLPGLCDRTWYMFAMGVLVHWWSVGRISFTPLAVLLLGTAASLVHESAPFTIAALFTAAALITACRTRNIHLWLSNPLFQFLGMISYSLYLIHGTIGWRVLSLGERLTGRGELSFACWSLAAGVASISAAYLMYVFIERPGMQLAARLKARVPRSIVHAEFVEAGAGYASRGVEVHEELLVSARRTE